MLSDERLAEIRKHYTDPRNLAGGYATHTVIDLLDEITDLKRRAEHVSEEGTACANCHNPTHAFQIPRLENDNARLRAALEQIADYNYDDCAGAYTPDYAAKYPEDAKSDLTMHGIARRALKGGER